MNNTILIIDLHSVLHNVKHGVGKNTRLSHNEKSTFVIYGFLYKLRNILKSVNHSIVVFACDSDSNLRTSIFPKYKDRKSNKTPEQIELDNLAYPQFKAIKEYVLPTMGYKNIFEFKGYEADDIIAQIVFNDYPLHNKIFATSDEDMYQCLSENCWMLRVSDLSIYSMDDFQKEYKIHPNKWVRVKAFGGCTSDTIPGLRILDEKGVPAKNGIGKTTALKYLRGELNPKSKAAKAFIDIRTRVQLEINKKLVILPLKGTPSVKIVQNKPSISGLQSIIKKYGFKSMAFDFEAFKNIMQLK